MHCCMRLIAFKPLKGDSMKYVLSIAVAHIVALSTIGALADTYTVDGHTFGTKPEAVKYVIASGKQLEVTETRCLILTNKLSLKSCPKNKKSSFDNEPFAGLNATK